MRTRVTPVAGRQVQAFSQERLQELIQHGGLTAAGEKRLKSADVRCRPESRYATKYFESGKLPQFRLATAEDAAAAEDCIALWAFVCGHGALKSNKPLHWAPFPRGKRVERATEMRHA